MLRWSARLLSLDLKYTWKISRNASDQKVNLVVEVADGVLKARGEAAPNIRYQETPEALMQQFDQFNKSGPETIHAAGELIKRMDDLGLAYALRFAIESAWHHLQASGKKVTVPALLELPFTPGVETSYTIPIMDPAAMKPFYEENRLSRFSFIKLKVDADEGLDALRYLCSFCTQPVMVDANEAFRDVDACIYFLEKIQRFPVEFVEQPLPSAMQEEQLYLKKYARIPLIADESITHDADFHLLARQFDGINVKLMKTGGYVNAIRLLRGARQHGMKTMIGCMVETTLGISSGMYLQSLADYLDLDSFLFVKNEPYGLIKEENGRLYLV